MGFSLSNIFGKTAGELVEKIGNVADEFITTKSEKEEFKLKVEEASRLALQKEVESAQKELDAYFKDVDSARNRELQINTSESSSVLTKNTTSILALFVTLGFFGMLFWMAVGEVPKNNERILDIMLGSLGTAWICIIGYYFGSSIGAKKSGDALRQMVSKK